MSQQLSVKGYLLVGSGCADGCAGAAPSGCPWDLTFGQCGTETYSQVRQADITIQTLPGEFADLLAPGSFTQIEFLALRSQAPITLRVNGVPARATSSAVFPISGLNALTLLFTVDGIAVSVAFVTGDDSALKVAARINAAAMLAGCAYLPASVTTLGQVLISGKKTGSQGSLSVFTGTAADDLGLDTVAAQVGTGADVPVSGLLIQQFGRNPNAVTRLEVSGSSALSVLAAGV
jgi:hypothetical protein